MAEFSYIARTDYDRIVKKDGKYINCYSSKKMAQLFPDGNYNVVGDIVNLKKNGKSGKKKVGDIRLFGKTIKVVEKKDSGASKYIQVGEDNRFIAIRDFDPLPFIIIGAIVILAAVIVALLLAKSCGDAGGDEDETFPFIEPIPEGVPVSGRTFESGGQPLPDVTVKLMYGSTVVAETKSAEDGTYSFKDIKSSLYDIVFEYGDTVVTKMISVGSSAVTFDYTFPEYEIQAKVISENEKSPAIIVGNLDNEAIERSTVDKPDQLTMYVDLIETPPDDAKNAIAAITGELSLTYFDFHIMEGNTELHETSNVIEIVVAYDTSYDVDTRVFRYHDGQAEMFEKLSEQPKAENYKDGTFFIANKYVRIYSNKFSVFALGSARGAQKNKGSTSVSFGNATLHRSTGIIDIAFGQGHDATHTAIARLYLANNKKEKIDILMGESEPIPPGTKMTGMNVKKNVRYRLADGNYYAVLSVDYFDEENPKSNTSMDFKIILTVVE